MTRRGLLASAAVLAGCGSADGGEPERQAEAPGGVSTLADVALLNELLALERRVGDEAHVAFLARLIRRRKGEVQRLDPGPVSSDFLTLRDQLVALYVDHLPKLSEPRLRGEVAGLLADAALRAAQRRATEGGDPAPEAFVDGVRLEERAG